MFGFDSVANPPGLGAAYADEIIAQAELALWELGHGYLSSWRVQSIRRHRRWVNELAAEVVRRAAA